MAWLEFVVFVINHKDDVEASLLYNMCHMYEHNLQQLYVDDITKIAMLTISTTYWHQNAQPYM